MSILHSSNNHNTWICIPFSTTWNIQNICFVCLIFTEVNSACMDPWNQNLSATVWYNRVFLCGLLVLLLLLEKSVKTDFFERRWPSWGWSVCPIYQVVSSLWENNILKQQSRAERNWSGQYPQILISLFTFSWPALIRKVILSVEKIRNRDIIALHLTIGHQKEKKQLYEESN